MSKDDNIIIYLLISSLDPPQKIFELINSVDQNAYVQAHEIFNNYVNLLKDDEIKSKRVKIPLDDNHAFHVFISEQALIFISYTNTTKFTTEKNFYLLEDINEFLTTEVDRKINEGKHSGLQFNGVSVDLLPGCLCSQPPDPETETTEYRSSAGEPLLLCVGRAPVYFPSAFLRADELELRPSH